APDTSCVLVGPGDFPIKGPDNSLAPRPRVLDIVAAPRETARAAGRAVRATLQFMGGEGSMAHWTSAQPATAPSRPRPPHPRAHALLFDFDGGTPMPASGGQPLYASGRLSPHSEQPAPSEAAPSEAGPASRP